MDKLFTLPNKDLDDIMEIADMKNEKRGAFETKIFLEKVIESE